MTCAHPANRRICRDAITFCDACGSILPPPSHSREEPAGLSDPAPASGEPAAAVVGPAAGSGGAACNHRDTTHHTRADGVTVCAFCGASLGWGAETWSNGVPNWHLDPATPSSPPAASISRAAAEEAAGSLPWFAVGDDWTGRCEFCDTWGPTTEWRSGERATFRCRNCPPSRTCAKCIHYPCCCTVAVAPSLVEQAETVGIRPLRERLEPLALAALHQRLDQSSEAWTLGVASLTERLRAIGDGQRIQGDRWAQLEVQLDQVRDAFTVLQDKTAAELNHLASCGFSVEGRVRDLELLADARATPTPTPTDPPAELAVYRERERCVRLALAVHEYELAARIAAGVS